MHLSTEEPASSRMLEPFGEVGGDVPEYFSSRTQFAKIEDKKLLRVGVQSPVSYIHSRSMSQFNAMGCTLIVFVYLCHYV